MHNLVLIDKRVTDYAAIVNAVDVSNDAHYIVFDVFELGGTGTGSDGPFAAIQAKISELNIPAFTSVGLVQHNNNAPFYQMFGPACDPPATIMGVETADPTLQTWSGVAGFITALKTNYGIQNFDMMACALYSDPNWKYIIDTLTVQTGVTIRASTDDTGAAALGGNWFLESHTGVNLKDVYFTEAIENYRGVLYLGSSYWYIYGSYRRPIKSFAVGGLEVWGNSGSGGTNNTSVSLTNIVGVSAHSTAYAAIKTDGSVVAWGAADQGASYTTTATNIGIPVGSLTGVVDIVGNDIAFAAIKNNGSVVLWGRVGAYGASNNTGVDLTSVVDIYATSASYAFAAIRSNGACVCWGDTNLTNQNSPRNNNASSTLTSGVALVYSNGYSFTALKTNGSVLTWGQYSTNNWGGDSSSVSGSLSSGVVAVYSQSMSHTALKNDGTLVTWGVWNGAANPASTTGSSGVLHVFPSSYGLAALKTNGSVQVWGNSTYVSSAPALTNVVTICSNQYSFAALKSDGTVVAWGNSGYGGSTTTPVNVASDLSGVIALYSNQYSYAALKSDGTVVCWGDSTRGGSTSSPLNAASQLTGVVRISVTSVSYSALKTNGSVIQWGSGGYGNTSINSANITSGIVDIFNNEHSQAALKPTSTPSYDLSMSYYSDTDRLSILCSRDYRRTANLVTVNSNRFTLSAARSLQKFNYTMPTAKPLTMIVPDYQTAPYSLTSTITLPTSIVGSNSMLITSEIGERVDISGVGTYVNYGTYVYKVETNGTYTKTTSLTINSISYNLYGGDGVYSSGIALYNPTSTTTTLSNFSVSAKTYGTDTSFNLTDPSSNSPAGFTFSSSNTQVATISGRTVTIVGPGTSVITASQGGSGNFMNADISASLVVAFGNLSSLSSKALTDGPFVIPAPLSNVLTTYGTTWAQLGLEILGTQARENSGWSVSLSADGTTLAIGSGYYDKSGGTTNGDTDEGRVRVYKYNGTSWVQLGSDILGTQNSEISGYSVSLSADGTTVAIGSLYYDASGGTANSNTQEGRVRVYKYNKNGTLSWDPLGSDILGTQNYEYSGHHVHLSADGTTVAFGSYNYDVTGTNADEGRTRIYKYNKNGTLSWDPLGSDILGTQTGEWSGWSVSLSADGTTVAIGSYRYDVTGIENAGRTRIYKYNNGTSWVQLGLDILGTQVDENSGYIVSLSADGTTVAIGCMGYDKNGGVYSVGLYTNEGRTRVYKIDSSGNYTYTIGNSAIADICGNIVLPKTIGSTTINVTQSASGVNASKSVAVPLTLVSFSPTFQTYTIASKTIVDASFNLTDPSSNSPGAFTFTSSNASVATISGRTVTITGTGITAITATQAASGDYATGSVTASFTVNLLTTVLGALTVPAKVYGDASFNLTDPTSNSPATITYTSGNTQVATISGRTITILGPGTSVITASQAAAGNYGAASTTASLVVAFGNLSSITRNISDGPFVIPAPLSNILTTYGTTWNKLGADIDGEAIEDRSGYSVSLSADGTVVAIGAHLNDGTSGTVDTGNSRGHVRVYKYTPGKAAVTVQTDSSFGPIGWTRLGQDIDGEFAGDNSGYTVSLSADGTVVAIGGRLNDGSGNLLSDSGHVRVYKYTPSKTIAVTNQNDASFGPIGWTRLGEDIDGETAGDASGYSVSLSADGTTVAIGATQNDGSGNGINFNCGHVRVYKYNPNKTIDVSNQSLSTFGPAGWDRLGGDIDGDANQGYSGYSVSLSADGTRVAIGAYYKSGSSGAQSGQVRVYNYNANKIQPQLSNQSLTTFGPVGWDRLGGDIDGEAAGDYSGISVSISEDGTTVAIGAYANDGGNSASDDRGHVRVYRYNPNKTIDVSNQSLTTFGPVGWDRLGGDIDGEATGDNSGQSVSLSADGNIVAIGAILNDAGGVGTDDRGHVRIYRYTPSKTVTVTTQSDASFGPIGWTRIGADIDGEAGADQSGWSVSTSADGTTVAIGAVFNDGTGSNAGHVRVYRIDTSGNYTYTIGNSAIADICGNIVLPKTIGGSTTINVTQAASGVNASKTASIPLLLLPITPTFQTYTITSKNFGDASFNLTDPSSNSAGAFTFTSSNASVATISGRTVTIVGAGTTTITATQAASGDYAAASTTASFTVNPIPTVLGALTVPAKVYGDASFNLTDPSSNSPATITYTSGNTQVATISGRTVTIVGPGTSVITASQAAAGNYTAASTTASLVVAFGNLSSISSKVITDGPFVIPTPTSNVLTTYGTTWNQLGADIDGEAAGDYSGRSVSVSADGTVVAIGALRNSQTGANRGHVRVYKYTPGKAGVTVQTDASFGPVGWTRLGADIDGEAAYDQSGYSVSLSADGTTVAIGASGNTGPGYVSIYKYTPSKTVAVTNQNDLSFGPVGWTRLGADIDGEAAYDESGTSVSLSADGTVVAIGAWNNDTVNTSDQRGHVRVYKYNPNKTVAQLTDQSLSTFGPAGWNRLGADIDGEAAGDWSGWSVSVSADGTVVAIGAEKNSGSPSSSGHVRVYKYNPNKTVAQLTDQSLSTFGPVGWDRLGEDIDGEGIYDQSGYSVSMSADGTVVAIGTPYNDANTGTTTDNRGHVRVYKYTPGKAAVTVQTDASFGPVGWTRLGADIDGEAASDQSGYYVSLSADGTIVAIGANQNDGPGSSTDNRGHVRVYRYTPTKTVAVTVQTDASFGPVGWTRIGADIDGEAAGNQSGVSVSLSNDGTTVAIGANLNGGTGVEAGHVRIYKIDTSGNYTYTIGNSAIADICGNIVLPKTIGSTTINVTQSASGANTSKSATVPLVLNLTTTTITRTTDASGTISKTFAPGLSFSVAATSSRGSAVTYSSSDTTVATVDSSSGLVTVLKAGSATLTAAQTQTSQYTAGSASWALTVALGTNPWSNTFAITSPVAFGDTITYTAPALSYSPAGAITYSTTTDVSNVATINSSSGAITLVGNGTVTFRATTAETSQYASSTIDSSAITVNRATTTITRTTDASGTILKTYVPDLSFSVAATSSRGIGSTVTYSSSDTTVATVDSTSGLVTVLKAGSATLTAAQTETTQYTAGSASWALTVALGTNPWSNTFAITSPVAFGDTITYTAPALSYSPAGAITYSTTTDVSNVATINSSSGVITLVGNGTVTFRATTAETSQYASSYIDTSVIRVNRATTTITRASDAYVDGTISKTYVPDLSFSVAATSSRTDGSAISYTSSDTTVATVDSSSGLVTVLKAGTTTITASQSTTFQYSAGSNTWDLTVALGTNPWSNTFSVSSSAVFGDTITYTAPSVTYGQGGAITYSTTTDVSNVATINASTGAITIVGYGTVTFRATTAETTQYASSSIDSSAVTINRATTTITRASDAYVGGTISKTYVPDLSFSVAATSSRGIGSAVTYSSSDTTVATVDSSSGLVTVLKAGPTTITAAQTETTQYTAGSASWALTVLPGTNAWSNTFAITSPVTFGDTVTYTAPALSYSPAGAITYSTTTDVSNVAIINSSSGAITLVGYGTVTFRATTAATSQYASSYIDSSAITVNRATTTITRRNDDYVAGVISKMYVTDLSFNVSATSSRPGETAVTYSSSDTTVATVNSTSGRVTVLKAGTATITASQTATAQYTAGSISWAFTNGLGINPWANTFSITSPVTFGDTVTYTPPVATYSPAGAITYGTTTDASNVAIIDSSSGVITLVGYGTVTFTATQAETEQYDDSTIHSSVVTVNRATTTITRASDAYVSGTISKTYSPDLSFNIAATSSRPGGGTSVLYSSSDTSVATVDASGRVTILSGTATGSPVTLTAYQAENAQYAYGSITWSLTVSLASNTITRGTNFTDATITRTYDPTSTTFNVSASSNNSISDIVFTSSDTNVASITRVNATTSQITINTAGSITITASQSASSKYAAATDISCALVINRRIATLFRSAPYSNSAVSKYYDPASFYLTASSVSDGAVTYESSNTDVAHIDTTSGEVILYSLGSATITASQANSSRYTTPINISWALDISRGNTTITGIPTDISKNVTNVPFYLAASSASSGTITYSLTDPSSNVATVNASSGLVTLLAPGTFTVAVSQAGTSLYNAPTSVSSTITVSGAGNILENITVNPAIQNFVNVDLSGASLAGSTISNVSFNGASLAGASLVGTTAIGASFVNAILTNTNFSGANISGADFTNANISGANISDLDLSTVQKLQLLKNINNREITEIQIPENVAGNTILSVIPQNSEVRQVPNIETSTFKVIVPYTTLSSSASLLNTVIDPASTVNGFYLPLNTGEYFKINGIKYYTVGTTIKNFATNATVEVITNNGIQYRLFVGSVTGVALQANTLSASTFTVPSVRLIGDTEPIYTTTFPTSNSDAAIVYSSNNPSVATINATTGQITMVSAGSVTFTASQAATLTYASGSKTSNQLTIYSTQVKISFNVSALDSTLQMDVSGAVPEIAYQLPTSDATSVFYVKLSDMKEVFKFQTDSFDVNDVSLSDIRYYVYKNKWPSTIKLNPAHSMVDVSESNGMMGSSGMFAQNKALLKHDYVRYLAYKLFRTIHGVDLFKNESDLLENISYWGETIRNAIENKLDLISTTSSDETIPIDGSGNRFLTNATTTNTNITRELMMQIVGNSRARLFNISGTTGIQSVPLMENDSFNIVITVFAAENQNILTGSDSISSRTYNMKVVLKNDITGLNVPVIDSEMFPNAYSYSGNVAVITADSSANYADYSPPTDVPVARYGFNGWYYKNTSAWVTVDPTVRNKIKWSVLPNTVSSKVSNLQYIRFNAKVYNKTSLPYITIYTASSKRAYLVSNSADITNNGKYTFYVNFGAYDRLPAVIDHTNKELTVSSSGALTQGSFDNNETITRIAVETDSAASYNTIEFTMSCIVVGETSCEKEHWFQ